MKKYMNEPMSHDVTSAEIVDFYCQCRNKQKTAKAYRISVEELNTILKAARVSTGRKSDTYDQIGMKRNDF